jgi:hypothetical protein
MKKGMREGLDNLIGETGPDAKEIRKRVLNLTFFYHETLPFFQLRSHRSFSPSPSSASWQRKEGLS